LIRRLFDQIARSVSLPDGGGDGVQAREEAIRKATAVLMLDVALADKRYTKSELLHLLSLAKAHFGLNHEEATVLIESARNEAEDLVSLYEFTQLLHTHLCEEEKASIVRMLWQIAYTDGDLDKFENALVLKISDLLYVSRGRVMRLKHDAEQAAAE
jgi:uncharacterized tellurite resistance protein B-like protein